MPSRATSPTRATRPAAAAAHTRKSATPRRARAWVRLSDEDLLKVRLCDLDLTVEDSRLARAMQRLYAELAGRGITFKPHAWLAEEWFSPDGVPGIAVPFFLAHPRLERLERRMMHAVEGGNTRWLMRILRHEAGHALDNAYRLRRRASWRETFGPASLPYPERYRARPGSRRYVHHLGEWYAQAHPTEDFAETFAVWLKPNSNWRRAYAQWPAFQKLCRVDELMSSVRERKAPVRNRRRIESIATDTRTLAEVYRDKLARRGSDRRGMIEELVQKVFRAQPQPRGTVRASTLIRAMKTQLVNSVSRELKIERYSIYQLLRMIMERCDALKLHVRGNRRDAGRHVRWMLIRLTRMYAQGETPQFPL